jgi:orotate phosphoribosyltransferase
MSGDVSGMRGRLAELLLEKSFLRGEMTLTSGKRSSYYFDCKQTALHPEGAFLLGSLLFERLHGDVEGIGGMTLGADPLVSAVSLVSYHRGRPLPGFIVRKKPKGHGTGEYLEGMANFRAGQNVAVLEDVVTTGGSLLDAVRRARDGGLWVTQIVCILDREEGGSQRAAEEGYRLESVFTATELLGDRI